MNYPTTTQLSDAADASFCEVFHVDAADARESRRNSGATPRAGWYYWQCFPGCLPEGGGDALGPFSSMRRALCDAYDNGFLGDELK